MSEQQEQIAKIEKEKEMDALKWGQKIQDMELALKNEMDKTESSMRKDHEAHIQLLRDEQLELKTHHEAMLS